MFGGAPIVCAVRAGSRISSLADYTGAARGRPETVSSGTSGAGSMGHLAALVFEQAAGVKLLHVPFRGAPEAQSAVLSGDTVSIWDTIGAHAAAVRQGSLRALAFTSAARVPLFPEVPTMAGAGVPGAVVTNWFLLAAPAGFPAEAAARVNGVCQDAMREPAVMERMGELGLVSLGAMSPTEIQGFVR